MQFLQKIITIYIFLNKLILHRAVIAFIVSKNSENHIIRIIRTDVIYLMSIP